VQNREGRRENAMIEALAASQKKSDPGLQAVTGSSGASAKDLATSARIYCWSQVHQARRATRPARGMGNRRRALARNEIAHW